MLRFIALAVLLIASACASLKSTALPAVGAAENAVVIAKRDTLIRSKETRAERAAWAAASLNPLVVAFAVLAVEDDFGRSSINEYDLRLANGDQTTVQSRYIVAPKQCVILRRSSDDSYVILVAQEDSGCISFLEPPK